MSCDYREAPDFAYLCGAERGETAYLNQAEVRTALHVCSTAECGDFPGANHWTEPYNHNKTQEEFHEGDLYRLLNFMHFII